LYFSQALMQHDKLTWMTSMSFRTPPQIVNAFHGWQNVIVD